MDKFFSSKGNSQGQKKEFLQKLQADKEQLKKNKEQGHHACIL